MEYALVRMRVELDVCPEPRGIPVAAVNREHTGVPQPFVVLQGIADLIELDPVATDLDLGIGTAAEVEDTVDEFADVAGAVKPRRGAVDDPGDEAAVGLLGPVAVAAGEL